MIYYTDILFYPIIQPQTPLEKTEKFLESKQLQTLQKQLKI